MRPASSTVMASAVATVTTTTQQPWGSHAALVRWDTPGAFTHSLTPRPNLTRWSRWIDDPGVVRPQDGAEYPGRNITLKNADVEFVVTGRTFAIRYFTYDTTDAMVWIDDRPVSATSLPSGPASDAGTPQWIVVTLPTSRTVTVRFAGPTVFTGVEHDDREAVTVSAAPSRFTLGVVADSYHEPSIDEGSASRSAAPMLRTLTGFRTWNMAEGGTGYVQSGPVYPGHDSLPFGSAGRLDDVAAAPIDALLVSGSLNDANVPAAQQRKAVDDFLTAVARVRPGLPVVLVGVEPVSYDAPDEPTAIGSAMTANLRDMATRHDNVVGFIDPYGENWLTGTGSTASPQGDGNQDQLVGRDRVHLNGAGQQYYEGRIVEQLRSLPAQLPAR